MHANVETVDFLELENRLWTQLKTRKAIVSSFFACHIMCTYLFCITYCNLCSAYKLGKAKRSFDGKLIRYDCFRLFMPLMF